MCFIVRYVPAITVIYKKCVKAETANHEHILSHNVLSVKIGDNSGRHEP